MKFGYINILRYSVLLLLMSSVFSSCYNDDIIGHEYTENSSGSSLQFISDPMQRYQVTTRASYTKDDAEKEIHNIHVFFFDKGGNYLKGGYLTGYPDAPDEGGYYFLAEGVTSLKIDNESLTTDTESAIIYAVANVDPSMFPIDENTGRPTNVETLAKLEEMDFSIGNEKLSLGIPENGIPMVSKVEMNLVNPSSKEHIVELTSLMSRIDVNIKLESDITDNNYPSLTLVDWTAKNLPLKGAFSEPTGNAQTGDKWPEETWTKSINTPLQRTIYNKNGEISFSFYMFENIQKAEWVADEGEVWQGTPDPDNPASLYPSEIIEKEENKYQMQRYKPYLANSNATAVELHAFYSTYNETGSGAATYEVRYTLYLGANYTDNFEVKRNHKYENNITIKGLTQVGTNPDHITFDARVNVKDQDNKYYIAMLRERNHDAHFCVTPMDVYLFEDVEGSNVNPTMEVILGEVPEGSETPSSIPDWIRMEKICAADMEAGTVTQSGFTEYDSPDNGTHLATHEAWYAGNGKRAFFTKDLLTNKDKLAEKGQHVTIDKTRDRVYFYIDENLELKDREAIVTLIYKENGTEKKRRTITIGQTHFLPVEITEEYSDQVTGNLEINKCTRDVTIYMEVYEEYLDHYDPLDEHKTEMIYEGLPWSRSDVQQNISFETISERYYFWVEFEWWSTQKNRYDYATVSIEPSHNWYQGWNFTNQIISKTSQNIMTLNDKPRSAVEYCFNRNKREEDGTVPDSNKKYFLPGIRQMERALTQYYTTFPEFQTSYYWSSSVGEREGGTSGQNLERARATKIKSNGKYEQSGGAGNYYYEQIDPTDGERRGGYAKRTEKLRIRAYRIDLNKVE